ncbi:MAG TPA: hypothetical protein VKE74_15620 [Gemmataceae bacterium]|nr:hypothetical protein [Gemmataceae bacterium]
MNRREVLAALAAGGVAATAATAAAPMAVNPDQSHIDFVAECARDIRKLSTAVKTRGELLEKFQPAGGRFRRELQSFSYNRCPWFKVSVTFEPADDGRAGKLEDMVTKISTPYLDDPFAE